MNKLGLRQTLFKLRMNNDNNISDHISRLESQFSKLQVMDITLAEALKVALLLHSISDIPGY